jgi:ABC-type branched-subunit amino acid transport system substrate-binding protein
VQLPEGPGREELREWVARLVLARPPPPHALILATEGASAGGILQALAETTWSGTLLGSADAGSVLLVDVAGEAAAGLIYASPAPAGQDLAEDAGSRAGLSFDELAPRAVLAYDATNVLLSAIDAATRTEGKPSRAGVVAAMRAVHMQGLTGDITFAEDGRRLEAPVWLYRIEGKRYPGELVR